MKKLIPYTLAALAVIILSQGCALNTMGEGDLFGEGNAPVDSGVEAAAGSMGDASVEFSPEVGIGGTSGTSGAGGEGGSSATGGSSGAGGSSTGGTAGASAAGGEGGTAGGGGSSATGGSSGTGGAGGSSGVGGASGEAGSGGPSGSGGTVADAGDEDAADAADAIAEDATPDVADAIAEDAAPDSSDAAEEPDAPWPTSPCGAYPPTGYAICWVYDHPSYPGLHMGLAGGVAGPGHFIENEWKDPMVGNAGNCVAPNGQQSYVLCTIDEQPIGTVVMFAGGLHQTQSSATESNNWACDLQKCYGEVYAYHNGVEIGKYVNFQAYAKVHTVMHFVANTHIDLAFNIP